MVSSIPFGHSFSPQDVSKTVVCATKLGLAVNARSGGYSYASFGIGGQDGHVIVDVSKLKDIKLDTGSGNAVIQAGTRVGEVATC